MRVFAGCFQLLMSLLGIVLLYGAFLDRNWLMLLIGLGVAVTSLGTLCHIVTRRPNCLSRYPVFWGERRRQSPRRQ